MNADKKLYKSVFIRIPFIPSEMGRGLTRMNADKKLYKSSNSQFNQKSVMLRSSEASRSSGGAGCFAPKTPLSMTVQRQLRRNYLVRTNT